MDFRKLYFLLFIFAFSSVSSQTRVKMMFYNLLNYTNDTESINRTPELKNILDFEQPDLFMVCELKSFAGSEYLYENAVIPFNSDFEKAPFDDSGTDLNQMVYYNSKKLFLDASKSIPTNTRDINRYSFILRTEDQATNPIKIEVFVTHLKASRGTSNRQRRDASIQDFLQELSTIPSDSYVIFSGDFNFYTSNEEGYKSLISDSNPIKIIDPINRPCPEFPNDGVDYFDSNNYNSTYFWNNSSFADVHTQSTRTSGGDGAGGGMDDRFDFIMMSENFSTSSDLYYVDNSYKATGNNGNCYNSFVSNTSCTGTYSQSIRQSLLNFSDHLPVVMEIETPQNVLSTENYQTNTTIVGSNIVTDELKITFKNQNVERFQVYNQLGKKVIDYQPNSIQSKKSINFSTKNLSSGVYYIKIANQTKPLKFIKL